ncbi:MULTISPECIES: STAS/SEC14 domain-containing protein [unclassified Ruegeria]|uniref:STAS/SEC14 domain-containing protein n=1 Tax=unclassified Ruegeria TaxID=2625375 RepID=UPI0014899DC8|nr:MULTISPECIES: STAS/SEC14 domain-containing protein [unclassified Ruegeria]NOD62906.1 STAS/SEC14 domain-containing protein [Ruegeria sp. HKCCD6109]
MITVHTNSDGALIEVELSGQVTSADYTNTLVPAIEAAMAEHDSVRLLAIVQPEFKGYDLGAAWSDTKLGLSHWRGFDRIAVVADQGWVQTSIRLAAPILPCPVQLFDLADLEAARRWMRESLGSIHLTDLGGPCVQISLLGKLDPEEYKQAERDLDVLLQDRAGFRLLIDLREFDGWQGLSALAAHFRLASRHIGLLDRAAIVGDKSWQHMAQKVASHVLGTRTQFFSSEEFDNAKNWLATG